MIEAKNLTFLQFAAELRVKGQFCDVELNVKDTHNKQRVVMAHKIIMMYYSSYLNHLLGLDSRRKSYQITPVTYAALLSVVKLLYREMSIYEFTGSHTNIEAAQFLNIDLHDKKSNDYLRKYYINSDTTHNIEGKQPSANSVKPEYAFNDSPTKDSVPHKLVLSDLSIKSSIPKKEPTFNDFPTGDSISEPVFNDFPTKDLIPEPVFNDSPTKNLIPEQVLNDPPNKGSNLEATFVDSATKVVPDSVFSSSPTKDSISENFHPGKPKAINESITSDITNCGIWTKIEGIDYSTIIGTSQNTSNTNSAALNVTTQGSEMTSYVKLNIYDENSSNINVMRRKSLNELEVTNTVINEDDLMHVEMCEENGSNKGNINSEKIYSDDIFEAKYNSDKNVNSSQDLNLLDEEVPVIETLNEIENKYQSSEEKVENDSGTEQFQSLNSEVKLGRKRKGPFKCCHCDRVLQTYSLYERHLTYHTGDKPFTCGVCGKSFNRKGNLVVHEKIHENLEKKFQCELCDSKFYTMSKLKHHIKHVHVPLKKKKVPTATLR